MSKAYANITITDLTDGSLIWSTTVAPTTPNYTFTISDLTSTGESFDSPKVGDIILYSVYRYTITTVSDTTVLAGYRQSLKGATGSTGTGVESITEEYYLSSSKTEQADGEWTTTPPTWESGKYIWTRSKIIYTNPSSTVYTTPICDSSWEAVNDINVGGRNLLPLSQLRIKSGYGFKTYDSNGYLHTENTSSDTRTASYANCDWQIDLNAGTYILTVECETAATNSNKTLILYDENGSEIAVNDVKGLILSGNTGKKSSIFTLSADISVGLFLKLFDGVYRFKLEVGNQATDWTPAPEDVDYNIYQNKVDWQDKASELEDKTGNIQASVNNLKDSMSDTQNDISNIQSNINKINGNYNNLDDKYNNAITNLQNALDNYKAEVGQYMSFDASTGLTLSALDEDNKPSQFKTNITSNRLAFQDGSNTVAFISNKQLYIEDAIITSIFILGGYAIVPRDDGGISVVWQGKQEVD